MRDTYFTVAGTANGYYTEKRSKFYSFLHHVESVDDVMALQREYRRKYYDARHVCYAYRLGADGADYRANDDGEPSSTAGKPILGVMLSADISDAVIFVVRYYGGVNLGTGGLVVAYREAASSAVDNALDNDLIVQSYVEEQFTYVFAYPLMNAVMRIIKDMQPRIIAQDFQTTCSITLAIRQSLMPQLKAKLEAISF